MWESRYTSSGVSVLDLLRARFRCRDFSEVTSLKWQCHASRLKQTWSNLSSCFQLDLEIFQPLDAVRTKLLSFGFDMLLNTCDHQKIRCIAPNYRRNLDLQHDWFFHDFNPICSNLLLFVVLFVIKEKTWFHQINGITCIYKSYCKIHSWLNQESGAIILHDLNQILIYLVHLLQ